MTVPQTSQVPRRRTSLALTAAVIAAAALATPRVSQAAGSDFSLNFTASAPYTCNHDVGGGAFDDATKGKGNDIVESLEGGDFACGDVVTYLRAVKVGDAPSASSQTIEFQANFLADTTGQTGAAHAQILSVGVNYGPATAG